MASTFWILNVSVLLSLVFLATKCQSAKIKPANTYFNLCSRKDPEINQCVAKAIENVRPLLLKGIPELRVIPLEPMFITKLALTEGQGNFRFAQTLSNMTIHGLGQYKVTDASVFLSDTDFNMKITMKVPHLRMDADYEMDGQILVLPIKGKGKAILHFGDVTAASNTKGSIVTRAGKQHIVVDDIKWDINVGIANSTFTNLFNGDKTLGDATNNFLNSNWKDTFETYKHLPEEAFGQVFKDLANQVYKRYPVNELFLD